MNHEKRMPLNPELWNSVLSFNIDEDAVEYGFSTRLADENFWTKQFTVDAILEYKKFMYLAATSDLMVSPSEIIDVVWHQHLIFTQSYQAFCNILGKQIQHIPSTHNTTEYRTFQQAKERTTKLYQQNFETQLPQFWNSQSMYDSLNLPKARFKLRSFIGIGFLAITLLFIPLFFILTPIYTRIPNPDFIFGFTGIAAIVLFTLAAVSYNSLGRIPYSFSADSFALKLHPTELVYLETESIYNVIHCSINELIENGTIAIDKNGELRIEKDAPVTKLRHKQIIEELKNNPNTQYNQIVYALQRKPIFSTIAQSMQALKKYMLKSKKFVDVFILNFITLGFLLMLFYTRIFSGIARHKHIAIVSVMAVVLTLIFAAYLHSLAQQLTKKHFPQYYKELLWQASNVDKEYEWQYFLAGNIALNSMLFPFANRMSKSSSDGGALGGCGSCGGGGSCGGCGGCGGCGS